MDREEAIKIVKENMHLSYDDGKIFEALKILVPELKESEDERIRKALVKTFEKKLEIGFEWTEFGIPNRSVLDWLEKQKEQKPVEWSNLDIDILGDAITATDMLGNDEKYKKSNPNLAKAFRVAKDWLKSLPERFNLQPKQEWSEEDKNGMFSDIIIAIRAFYMYEREDLVEYFKSLRPQPKQEWSEEDEHCIELLDTIIDSSALIPKNRTKCHNFLKSLRPQPKRESEPMEIKYAGKIYKVYGTKEFPGGVVGYKIEDEPGYFDYIINPDEVLGGGYDIKSNGSPYPTNDNEK